MVNNAQTQAYLFDNLSIMRDDIDEIKAMFWSKSNAESVFDDDIPF